MSDAAPLWKRWKRLSPGSPGGALALFVAAAAVRALFLSQLSDTPFGDERALIDDAAYYDQRGRAIAAGELVGGGPSYLSPLYTYLVGTVYALFGAEVALVKWTQVLLGAATCVLLADLGRRVFGALPGLVAGWIAAFYGPLVYYTGLLLPTTTVLFLDVLALGLLARDPPEARGAWRPLAAGLVLGLAVAAKANALLLVPVLAAWLLTGGASWPRRRVRALALVLGAALGLAPFVVRDHLATGHFFLVPATGGLNLLKGNGPAANGTHVFLTPEETGVNLADYARGTVDADAARASDRRMRDAAVDSVLADPARAAGLFARKLLLSVNAFELGIRDQYRFARRELPLLRGPLLGFGLVAPFGLAGLVHAWRRGRPAGLAYALLAVQLATLVLVFVLARYRLVVAVCLFLFAGAELERLRLLARERARGPLLRAAGLLLASTALVHAPVPGFPFEDRFTDAWVFVGDARHREGDLAGALDAYGRARESTWVSGSTDMRAVERRMRRIERELDGR